MRLPPLFFVALFHFSLLFLRLFVLQFTFLYLLPYLLSFSLLFWPGFILCRYFVASSRGAHPPLAAWAKSTAHVAACHKRWQSIHSCTFSSKKQVRPLYALTTAEQTRSVISIIVISERCYCGVCERCVCDCEVSCRCRCC